MGPYDVAFIEATPVGLIKPYFRGVCLSCFTKANPNMTNMLLGIVLADEASDSDNFFSMTMQLAKPFYPIH